MVILTNEFKLWRWQPARGDTSIVPTSNWGYFKVPVPWPGLEDWLQ